MSESLDRAGHWLRGTSGRLSHVASAQIHAAWKRATFRRTLQFGFGFASLGILVGILMSLTVAPAPQSVVFGVPVGQFVAGLLLVFAAAGTFVLNEGEHDRNRARDRAADYEVWVAREDDPKIHSVAWRQLMRIVREDSAAYAGPTAVLATEAILKYLTLPCFEPACAGYEGGDGSQKADGGARTVGDLREVCRLHPVSPRWFDVAWSCLLEIWRIDPDAIDGGTLEVRGRVLRSAHFRDTCQAAVSSGSARANALELDLSGCQVDAEDEGIELEVSSRGGLTLRSAPRYVGKKCSLAVRAPVADGLILYGPGSFLVEGPEGGPLALNNVRVDHGTRLEISSRICTTLNVDGVVNNGEVCFENPRGNASVKGLGGKGVYRLRGALAADSEWDLSASEGSLLQPPILDVSGTTLRENASVKILGFMAPPPSDHPDEGQDVEKEFAVSDISIAEYGSMDWEYATPIDVPNGVLVIQSSTFNTPKAAACPSLTISFAGVVENSVEAAGSVATVKFRDCGGEAAKVKLRFGNLGKAVVLVESRHGERGFDADTTFTIEGPESTVFTLDPLQVLGANAHKSSDFYEGDPSALADPIESEAS